MHCHICQAEASGRCYTCGELFCEQHGQVNCDRCAHGIRAGDNRADRISAARMKLSGGRPWWRPQEAEEYDPPACHECQGLARYTCLECSLRYCGDHAGERGLCAGCFRKLKHGNLVTIAMLTMLGILTVLGMMQAYR